MLLRKIYVPDYLRGNTIILRDHSYSLSIDYEKNSCGTLYVDKSIFFATGLPLKQRVKWCIKDKYLYFFSSANPQD